MPNPNETEAVAAGEQDLGISVPRQADQNWARMQPVQITASKERLDQPHQLVTIRNTSREQKHIIIDRHMVGHEFEPGQTRTDIDMLVSEINYFLRERNPSRRDALGRPKPIHPIEIVGIINPVGDGLATQAPQAEPPKQQPRKAAAA